MFQAKGKREKSLSFPDLDRNLWEIGSLALRAGGGLCPFLGHISGQVGVLFFSGLLPPSGCSQGSLGGSGYGLWFPCTFCCRPPGQTGPPFGQHALVMWAAHPPPAQASPQTPCQPTTDFFMRPEATSRERATQHFRSECTKMHFKRPYCVQIICLPRQIQKCEKGEKHSFTKAINAHLSLSEGTFYKISGRYAKGRKQPRARHREKAT